MYLVIELFWSAEQAWAKVLLDRGVREASPVSRARRPFNSGDAVLEPGTGVGVPLMLTMHTPVDSNPPFNVSIDAGDPTVCVTSIFDCACERVVGSTHFVDSGTPLMVKTLRLNVVSSVELLS